MKMSGNEQLYSNLEDIFNRLSIKSNNSIVNSDEFTEFNQYMHIKRNIQDNIEDAINNFLFQNNKKIIFIVGNVGDGKSHLLSYMTKKYYNLFKQNGVNIHNDATETNSPNKTAIDTLLEILEPYNNNNLTNKINSKLIIAINLGVLTNLLEKLKTLNQFTELVYFIENTQVLTKHKPKNVINSYFKIVSFIGESNIDVVENQVTSKFYKLALHKVFSEDETNPFYKAYIKDLKSNNLTYIHQNYKILLNQKIQETIVYMLIRAEIEHKLIISARTLFNFFYDIVVGNNNREILYLPNSIFDNYDKSDLLNIISKFNPIKNSTKEIDNIALKIYHAKNRKEKVLDLLDPDTVDTFDYLRSFDSSNLSFTDWFNYFLRIKFLVSYEDKLFDNSLYLEYLAIYKNVYEVQKKETRLVKLINSTYSKWNGYLGYDDKIIKNRFDNKVKRMVRVRPNPKLETQRIEGAEILIDYYLKGKKIELVVDYKTFFILNNLNNGYFLKSEDRKNSVNFDNFINLLVSVEEQNEDEVYLYNVVLKKQYKLIKHLWGEYKLERID